MASMIGVAVTTSAGRWHVHLVRLFVLAVCGMVPALALAEVPFVYRFDTRPPSEIFAMGFVPKGDDANLINHTVRWSEQSAFIATTSSYDAALQFAQAYFQRSSAIRGYIYRIAADEHFYEVAFSLENFLERERAAGIGAGHEATARSMELALHDFRWEQEYVTARPIPPSSISWGVEVRGVHGAEGVVGVREQHGHQLNPRGSGQHNDFANTGPYPMSWPSAGSSTPSCAADDGEGAAGGNCTDDLFAVDMGGGLYLNLPMFPACASPQREKRDAGGGSCSDAAPLINLSKLARAIAAVSPDPQQAVSSREEL